MLYGSVAFYIGCCYNQTLLINVSLDFYHITKSLMLSVNLLINQLCLCAILISQRVQNIETVDVLFPTSCVPVTVSLEFSDTS